MRRGEGEDALGHVLAAVGAETIGLDVMRTVFCHGRWVVDVV